MPIYANRAECSETLATEEMSLEFFFANVSIAGQRRSPQVDGEVVP